jgi:hypothetical protein
MALDAPRSGLRQTVFRWASGYSAGRCIGVAAPWGGFPTGHTSDGGTVWPLSTGCRSQSISIPDERVALRSRVGSTAFSAIYNRSGAPGLVVEDTTPDNTGGTCISTNNFTARRVEMTGCENGATAGNNVTIEASWIHDLDTSGGAHTDGIQFTQGGSNVTIRHNNIDPLSSGRGCTSAIIMNNKEGRRTPGCGSSATASTAAAARTPCIAQGPRPWPCSSATTASGAASSAIPIAAAGRG